MINKNFQLNMAFPKRYKVICKLNEIIGLIDAKTPFLIPLEALLEHF